MALNFDPFPKPHLGPLTLDKEIEKLQRRIYRLEQERDFKAEVISILHLLLVDPDIEGGALTKIVELYRHTVFHDVELEKQIADLSLRLHELIAHKRPNVDSTDEEIPL